MQRRLVTIALLHCAAAVAAAVAVVHGGPGV
jgi:hypothetical protein